MTPKQLILIFNPINISDPLSCMYCEFTPLGQDLDKIYITGWKRFVLNLAFAKFKIPFLHDFILRRFNTNCLSSDVMFIWINMCAVPSLVPLQVIFTQNSAIKRDSNNLTKKEFSILCNNLIYKKYTYAGTANIHKKRLHWFA